MEVTTEENFFLDILYFVKDVFQKSITFQGWGIIGQLVKYSSFQGKINVQCTCCCIIMGHMLWSIAPAKSVRKFVNFPFEIHYHAHVSEGILMLKCSMGGSDTMVIKVDDMYAKRIFYRKSWLKYLWKNIITQSSPNL